MSAAALLESLSRDGVSVECVADRLKIHAPQKLNPQILDAIRCNKSELLELLALERASTRADNASTRTDNGRDFDAGAAYEPALAYAYAARQYRLGRITSEQRDNLQRYALEAAGATGGASVCTTNAIAKHHKT